MRAFSAILTVFLLSQAGFSQNIPALLNAAKQNGQFAFEANPTLNMRWDYSLTSDKLSMSGKPITFGASINLPLFAQSDGFDIDFSIGAAYLWRLGEKFEVMSGAKMGFYNVSDLNGRFFNYGLRIDLFPGHYTHKWILAGHLAFDYRPFVHIKHKSFSKAAFEDLYIAQSGEFMSPQDGWFTQHLRFGSYGIFFAYRKDTWNVNLTIDYSCPLTPLGFKVIPEIGMLPFSASVGYSYIIEKSN